MSEEDRDIDILLRRNVDRQLEGFDWEGFRRSIDGRLVGTGTAPRAWSLHGSWVALAAVVTLAVGLVTLVVIRGWESGPRDSIPGQAKTAMIEAAHAPGAARVSLLPVGKSGQCAVRILPPDKPRRESGAKASWCIVVGHDSWAGRRSASRDVSDVMCLF